MVGLGPYSTLAEVDGGRDIGKAVGRCLTDLILNMDKVQGERYARFTKADLLGLDTPSTEVVPSTEARWKVCSRPKLLMSMHSPC